MSTTTASSHKRQDSGRANGYDGLPKLLAKPAYTTAKPRCGFLELPPDIRNIIYELVFFASDGIFVDFSNDNYRFGLGNVPWLASTCRRIRWECKELPYWLNTFHFRVPVFQDLKAVRAISPSMLKFPLPAKDPSPRRHIRSIPAQIIGESTEPKLMEEFVTMAMRDPHVDEIMQRLDAVIGQSRITASMRKVHIDLGSITNNTFLNRVFHAWEEVAPRLAALCGNMSVGSEIRLVFQLRLSRRFVVDYDFTLEERIAAMREMDLCVSRGASDVEEFTLPELSTINAMRQRVWETFFVGGMPGENPLPPRLSRTFSSPEDCKEHSMRYQAFGSHGLLEAV